jgi:hypothetical protein
MVTTYVIENKLDGSPEIECDPEKGVAKNA